MKPLSERLMVMQMSLENLYDEELANFDEAIALAKRYEDAPVGLVMGQGLLTEGTAAIVQTEKPGDVKGKRVRIVEE